MSQAVEISYNPVAATSPPVSIPIRSRCSATAVRSPALRRRRWPRGSSSSASVIFASTPTRGPTRSCSTARCRFATPGRKSSRGSRRHDELRNVEYHITQYDLEQGALEIQYIEEYFGEFPRKKTAAEIVRRLTGRAHLILLATAPLPDKPLPWAPPDWSCILQRAQIRKPSRQRPH